MSDAIEREKVMLTHRIERDVSENHHLIVTLVELDLQLVSRILTQFGEHLRIHVGDSSRSVEQAIIRWIQPELPDQRDRVYHRLAINAIA